MAETLPYSNLYYQHGVSDKVYKVHITKGVQGTYIGLQNLTDAGMVEKPAQSAAPATSVTRNFTCNFDAHLRRPVAKSGGNFEDTIRYRAVVCPGY